MNDTFWLADKKRFAFALDKSDHTVDEPSVLATVPMWFGLLDEPKADAMISQLADLDQQTDWGMRIISDHSPKFSGGGYHFGSVWPLFTGWAAVGEYRYHRALPAYESLRANALSKNTATRLQRDAQFSSLLTLALDTYDRLPDPYDAKADLDGRARSYLHSNCAQCHVEAGGGNAQIELEFTTKLDKMRIVNIKPVHDSYGIPDAKLIYPGQPEKSVLLRRISHRDKGHMPPLATALVDEDTVELMHEWIVELGAKPDR